MSMNRIGELAELSELDYEKVRTAQAKALGVRVGALDRMVRQARKDSARDTAGGLCLHEVEPWPEPIDGDALLDGIAAAVTSYVRLPDGGAEAVALWVVHTHCYQCFHITPRLSLKSALPRSGKTTLLDVIERMTPRSFRAENISTAVFFRLIDAHRPTALIDEVDSFLRGNEELRGALNAGHRRGGQVLRCEGDDNELKGFRTFAPVALAGIGRLPATLQDRSITLEMKRRMPGEPIRRFRQDRTHELEELGNMAARWAMDHEISLAVADPDTPEQLDDRAADNWRPLLAIADLAGGDWPNRAREVAVLLSGGSVGDEGSIRTDLLMDIKAIFGTAEAMASKSICDRLTDMEDRPWPEYRNGKPISQAQLARLLGAFRIKPKQIKLDGINVRGYDRAAFEDAWCRNLPREVLPTLQPAENLGCQANSDLLPGNGGSTLETGANRQKTWDVAGVALQSPDTGDDGDMEEREAIQAVDGMPELPSFLDRRTGT